MSLDPLANVAKAIPLLPPVATTRRAIVTIPAECYLMIPAAALPLLADARFVKIDASGNIRPLPMGNINATVISVADAALASLDQAYFQTSQEKHNGN